MVAPHPFTEIVFIARGLKAVVRGGRIALRIRTPGRNKRLSACVVMGRSGVKDARCGGGLRLGKHFFGDAAFDESHERSAAVLIDQFCDVFDVKRSDDFDTHDLATGIVVRNDGVLDDLSGSGDLVV